MIFIFHPSGSMITSFLLPYLSKIDIDLYIGIMERWNTGMMEDIKGQPDLPVILLFHHSMTNLL